MHSAPRNWRGALIVSVLDGRPLAISWMPGPTLWPFIMSLGFLSTFVGLLVDNLWITGVGLTTIAVSVVGWFWPNERQEMAMAEIGEQKGPEALPLAMGGPQSNGYWAMWIFMLVMSVAFATIIAAYFYLSNGPAGWPPRIPDMTIAIWATLAAVMLGSATFWLGRSMRRGNTGQWRAATAASIASAMTLGWLSMRAWSAMGLAPVESAYGSIVVVTIGFNWMVITMLLLMLAFTMAWAILRPKDVRGHGLAWLTELQGYYAAASWLMTFAVIYLTPYTW